MEKELRASGRGTGKAWLRGFSPWLVIAGLFFALLVPIADGQTVSSMSIGPASVKSSAGSWVHGILEKKNGETVLTTKKESYTLSNAEVLPRFSEPFPLDLETKRKGNRFYLEIQSAHIRSIGRWRRSYKGVVDLRATPQLKQLDLKVEELNEVVSSNLNGRLDDQDVVLVMGKYKETRYLLETLFPTVKDQQVLAAMLELKRDLESEQRIFFHYKLKSESADGAAHVYLDQAPPVEKRFYRLNDNYRPEIYDMISQLCASAVAIGRIGSDVPLGSGVLIAPNLVLTCRHNINQNAAASFETSEYDIWFDYEERVRLAALNVVKYDCREVYRSRTLDFSLLEIRPQHGPDLVTRQPVAISVTRVQRWTPIFLVGYPQGIRRIVHDGAWVLFPYQLLSNQERGEIQTEIASEFVDWTAAGEVEAKTEIGVMKAGEFMDDHYGAFQNGDAVSYGNRIEGQPAIGAECDTFRGDSGAPAILRETGKLIGILYKGADDIPGQTAATSVRKPSIFGTAGAKTHEFILPITAVIEDLNKEFPNWRDYGVTVER